MTKMIEIYVSRDALEIVASAATRCVDFLLDEDWKQAQVVTALAALQSAVKATDFEEPLKMDLL